MGRQENRKELIDFGNSAYEIEQRNLLEQNNLE